MFPAAVIQAVLEQYPSVAGGRTVLPLGNSGGFSGARLWRVAALGGVFCLKAWPAETTDEAHLHRIHYWMTFARAQGLMFVPRVFATRGGATWVRHAGW